MADDPKAHPKEGTVIPVIDIPHAPFIYFEAAPTLGHANGVINITLAAGRTWVGPDGVVNDQVVTGYLRGNIPAFRSLRYAIDRALLLAAPTQEGKAN